MPHYRVFPVIALSLLWVASPPARAAEPEGAPAEVVMSARRIPGLVSDLSRVPANATVITADEIRRSGASTIQDVLSKAEGVTCSDQQGFGLGSDSTVNLRGVVNSARTNALVLVDGIRQNRITGDDVHWQAIPLDDIERIEILRGGGGVTYGEGALAGVINIVMKRAGRTRLDTQHSAEVGSYGWQKYYTGVRGRMEPFGYGLGYTRRLVDGYRESSSSRNSTVTTHAEWTLSPLAAAGFHLLHSEDVTGFPGLLTAAQTQQRRRQTNPFHGVNSTEIDQAAFDVLFGPWYGTSSALTLFWRRHLQWSEDSIDFNAFTVTPSRGAHFRTSSEWTAGAVENLLVSGIELSEDKATTGDRDAFSGTDSESNRAGYGFYVEDTLTAWDRASVVGGLRFDKSRYEEAISFPDFTGSLRFEGWSPKVGVIVTTVPDRLELFGSYARPFKAPNVDDFSSRIGSSFRSNADLKPQQGDSYEAGARLRIRAVRANATAFYTRIDREILLNPFTFTNENFDTRRFGAELGLRGEWPDQRLRASAAYTFMDAEFRKGTFNARTIPGAPEHTFHASLGVSPVDALWIDLDWTLVADAVRFNDVRNQLSGADNYGVLDLTCRYALPGPNGGGGPDMSAYLKVHNLTNEEYVTYQSSDGAAISAGEAPMPPTTVLAGVTLDF
jgi:iron complex outermembrane receptor protein